MRNHGRPTFDQILFDQLTSYRKVNFRRNYCSVYDIHVVPFIIKLTRRLNLDQCVTEFLCSTRIEVVMLSVTVLNRISSLGQQSASLYTSTSKKGFDKFSRV